VFVVVFIQKEFVMIIEIMVVQPQVVAYACGKEQNCGHLVNADHVMVVLEPR
jgi:hypothetical protein